MIRAAEGAVAVTPPFVDQDCFLCGGLKTVFFSQSPLQMLMFILCQCSYFITTVKYYLNLRNAKGKGAHSTKGAAVLGWCWRAAGVCRADAGQGGGTTGMWAAGDILGRLLWGFCKHTVLRGGVSSIHSTNACLLQEAVGSWLWLQWSRGLCGVRGPDHGMLCAHNHRELNWGTWSTQLWCRH